MRLSKEEKLHIDEQMQALFPTYKKVEEFDNQVHYQDGKLTVCIFKGLPHIGEPNQVILCFNETNDHFGVAYMDFVINKKRKLSYDHDYLLKFLSEHIKEMSDYSFCNKCLKKYDKHLKRVIMFERLFRRGKRL